MPDSLAWTNDPPTKPGWYYEMCLNLEHGGSMQSCCYVAFPSLCRKREGLYYCGPLPRPARPPKDRKWIQRRWEIRKQRIAETGSAAI
jgi:hypothetical protein